MIHFLHPEALLLALPLGWLLLRPPRPRALVLGLRLAVALLVLGLLAEPYRRGAQSGRDLVLVVDRSRSVPAEAAKIVEELAREARARAQPGDRIGCVTFGRHAAIESTPHESWSWTPPAKQIDADATDLLAGLEAGLALIPDGRRGSLLVVSDGEATGADAAPLAREALRRGVRLDAVHVPRPVGGDAAIDELAAPSEVGAREPFQFSGWVRSETAGTAAVRLLRDGVVIAERADQPLRAGLTRLLFRDVLGGEGVHRYELAVEVPGDARPENNRARAVVRVVGEPQILCVTPGGREDRLTRSLRGAGLRVAVHAPATAPLSLDALDAYRAVVLENVPAQDLPAGALAALGLWVRELGGGLLMTGGKASFGPGGYYKSDVEKVLPVSMEVRQEQRKFALAMAIALDRSGSMQAPVGDGRRKMDLANLGTVAAIELLSPLDSVAVIAVDSQAHVVVPMSDVTAKEPILERVRGIESMGGGIFTSTAIHAAARQLASAAQGSKHVVLFADAADAEEPGDLETFVPELAKAGVTLSVIGLGSETDTDAAFLKRIAELGNGRCAFVADPNDLPRVFAQETIQVARSSVVEASTSITTRPELLALSALEAARFPTVAGYSLAWPKPAAQVGATTADEQQAPFVAFAQHGLGRGAVFLGEADGGLSGGLSTWGGYAGFFATLVRWLAGSEARGDVFADFTREGHQAVLRVEVAEDKEALVGQLRAHVLDADGKASEVVLARTGERVLEARLPLTREGVWRAAVAVGGSFLRVPPVTLPYSPEFEPRADARSGEKTLQRLVDLAGGRLSPPLAELWAGPRAGTGVVPLASLCAWILVVALLLEIAVRRLGLSLPRFAFPAWRWRRAPAAGLAEAARQGSPQPPPVVGPAPPSAEAARPPGDMASVLERARARGRSRRP